MTQKFLNFIYIFFNFTMVKY